MAVEPLSCTRVAPAPWKSLYSKVTEEGVPYPVLTSKGPGKCSEVLHSKKSQISWIIICTRWQVWELSPFRNMGRLTPSLWLWRLCAQWDRCSSWSIFARCPCHSCWWLKLPPSPMHLASISPLFYNHHDKHPGSSNLSQFTIITKYMVYFQKQYNPDM